MKKQEGQNKEERDFYWDWIKHEDNLFSNRANFFVVAETMLFAALGFFSGDNQRLASSVVHFTGILVSLVWLWTSIKQVYRTEKYIKNRLAVIQPLWREIADRRKDRGPSVHFLIGVALPFGFSIVWLILWFN